MRMIVSESSVTSKSAHRFLLVKSQLVGWPPAGVALPGRDEPEPDAFIWPDDEGLCIESKSATVAARVSHVGCWREFKSKKGVRVSRLSAREPTGGIA